VLRGLAEQVGVGSSAFKELTAWLSQKVNRVKLAGESPSDFGTFEALEFLQLGIHGKWALWQALAVVATTDERLRGTDFLRLATRAATQESQVEQMRLQAARLVFQPAA
jgi:ABC-type hemin transport system ATPase subunit